MYAIDLPKELLWRLARIRDRNRKPIARQVREAVQAYCEREETRTEESGRPDSEEAVST